MLTFITGQRLEFYYTNHRGERALRLVDFQGLDFGHNEWYPEKQWFLRGIDRHKKVYRSFALNQIETHSLKKVD